MAKDRTASMEIVYEEKGTLYSEETYDAHYSAGFAGSPWKVQSDSADFIAYISGKMALKKKDEEE